MIGVIVNPKSGRARGIDRVALAASLAAASREPIEIAPTRRAGHAPELVRDFVRRGASRIVAWGGDGTVNEVAGAILGTGAIFGIVPAGSGDGLARGLGLPREAAKAFNVATTAAPTAIDVGFLGGRHFLNIAGVGFDAYVGHAFNAAGAHGPRGGLRYAQHGLSALLRYEHERYQIDLPGLRRDGTHFLIAFANAPEYGNGVVIAPDADPTDGWLEALVVESGSPVRQLWRARRLVFGQRRPAQGVHRLRVKEGTIAAERLICHVDGETFEAQTEVRVSVKSAALLVAGVRRRTHHESHENP
jgi:diacylglycerol kinase family enzyme